MEITIETTLRNKLALRLVKEAKARNLEPVVLLSMIVEHVLEDNLVAAVVDA